MQYTPADLETDHLAIIADREIFLNQNQWPVLRICVLNVEFTVYVLDAGVVTRHGNLRDTHVDV